MNLAREIVSVALLVLLSLMFRRVDYCTLKISLLCDGMSHQFSVLAKVPGTGIGVPVHLCPLCVVSCYSFLSLCSTAVPFLAHVWWFCREGNASSRHSSKLLMLPTFNSLYQNQPRAMELCQDHRAVKRFTDAVGAATPNTKPNTHQPI